MHREKRELSGSLFFVFTTEIGLLQTIGLPSAMGWRHWYLALSFWTQWTLRLSRVQNKFTCYAEAEQGRGTQESPQWQHTINIVACRLRGDPSLSLRMTAYSVIVRGLALVSWSLGSLCYFFIETIGTTETTETEEKSLSTIVCYQWYYHRSSSETSLWSLWSQGLKLSEASVCRLSQIHKFTNSQGGDVGVCDANSTGYKNVTRMVLMHTMLY